MNRSMKVTLALSILANLFFYSRFYYNKPDVDFYGQSRDDAYLIKRHLTGEAYLIEHREHGNGILHQYVAKCQSTLSWIDGIENPGRPMSDGCTYIPGDVGKTIAGGLMRDEGRTIVYTPWANIDTLQTADVLTIESDEVIK